jgi:hypothetical protein
MAPRSVSERLWALPDLAGGWADDTVLVHVGLHDRADAVCVEYVLVIHVSFLVTLTFF